MGYSACNIRYPADHNEGPDYATGHACEQAGRKRILEECILLEVAQNGLHC